MFVRSVAFEFDNMETDFVMPVNCFYLILVGRCFKLVCISRPWDGKCKKSVLLRHIVSGHLVHIY